MTLTKKQEMVAENLRNGSIQAFAEGKELERQDTENSEVWHSMEHSAPFAPAFFLYRVRRAPSPREWWEVRDENDAIAGRTYSLAEARREAERRGGCIVHVCEVIE